jgi:hypothetical protein
MAPTGKVGVTLLSDEEISISFQVLSNSFGHDAPFIDMYFPHHDTPAGQIQGSKRLAAWKQTSKNSTFLKATTRAGQGDQEHIIGLAVWTYMSEPPPAELEKVENVEEVWLDKDDREYMTRLWRDYVIPRTQVIKDCGDRGIYGKWSNKQSPEYSFSHPEYSS